MGDADMQQEQEQVLPPTIGENKRREESQGPPPEAEGDEDAGGGRSLRDVGVEHGDGSMDPPPAEETPEQRRAKIALSYARLGLG